MYEYWVDFQNFSQNFASHDVGEIFCTSRAAIIKPIIASDRGDNSEQNAIFFLGFQALKSKIWPLLYPRSRPRKSKIRPLGYPK